MAGTVGRADAQPHAAFPHHGCVVRERHAPRGDPAVLALADLVHHREQLETLVVPGLLQTPDYTRALVTRANPGMDFEVAERRVLARMARQRVLNRPKPLRYHVIIDETVLARPIGTPSVMRGQLAKLVDAAEAEHITIQVLALSAGASPAVNGSFSILTLPDPIPDFGYAESQGGSMYIEDRAHVRALLEKWGILTGRALPPAESLDVIRAAGETVG
jgi:hypothetical protein